MTATASRDAIALPGAADVLGFWHALGSDRRYRNDEAVDAEIRARFEPLHAAAAADKLGAWENEASSDWRLITCSISSRATSTGVAPRRSRPIRLLARSPAARSIAASTAPLTKTLWVFFYLPLMHSELLADQERCCALCRALGNVGTLAYAERHADIVRRFGRFPHRNSVLGHVTTPEEQAFFAAGGFAG